MASSSIGYVTGSVESLEGQMFDDSILEKIVKTENTSEISKKIIWD